MIVHPTACLFIMVAIVYQEDGDIVLSFKENIKYYY